MPTTKYDLAIIGASAAGFAAAGVAAQQGARVVVFRTGAEALEGALASPVPNFIWRILDLHKSGLKQTPAPAQIVLAEDEAEEISSFIDQAKTSSAFAEREAQAGAVYPEFCGAASRQRSADTPDKDEKRPLLDFSLFDTANEVLEDYFHDERIRTLLAAAALLRFGLAGDEPGSAATFKTFGAEGWPSRTTQSRKLSEALKAACLARDVSYIETPFVSVLRNGRSIAVQTADDETYTAKRAMAASADIARAIGLFPLSGDAALHSANGAIATVRILLEEAPPLDDVRKEASFFVVDDREHLLRARDAMLEGRLSDPPPFSFYMDGATIIARAPYCPASLMEDGEIREWSGQDRQAFGRQIFDLTKDRLKQKMIARTIDVRIDQRAASTPGLDIASPSLGDNEIRAAAELALELTRGA
jgi:phytoene dehydrogenase-like protein